MPAFSELGRSIKEYEGPKIIVIKGTSEQWLELTRRIENALGWREKIEEKKRSRPEIDPRFHHFWPDGWESEPLTWLIKGLVSDTGSLTWVGRDDFVLWIYQDECHNLKIPEDKLDFFADLTNQVFGESFQFSVPGDRLEFDLFTLEATSVDNQA
jgi:hypothetical protein